MEQDLFIKRKTAYWTELDSLIGKIRKKGIRSLPGEELKELGILYKRICSDLSFAQSSRFDRKLIEYLNASVGRAYAEIYRDEPFTLRQVGAFFAKGFPSCLRENRSFVLAAALIFFLSSLFAFGYIYMRPEYASYFVSADYLRGIEGGIGERPRDEPLTAETKSTMSHMIMTNNITVGINAFALGIFYGIGTVYLLITNGALLGALAALCARNNESLLYWSLILPHGVIELPAIVICGGAGFLLAYALINPGELSRIEALKMNGKKASNLMLGVMLMFIVAAIIEGFVTPLPILPWWKIGFSAFVTLALFYYFARK